jgi:hypothetical protein
VGTARRFASVCALVIASASTRKARARGARTPFGYGRLRVGIDGLTASGKTSFGHELAEWISDAGRAVLRASLDDFKKPWRDRHLYDRESGEGYYRNAFDYAAVTQLLLEPAGDAGSGNCVLCSIDPLTQVDHSAVITPAAPDAVLVVDGVFAFRSEIDVTGTSESGYTSIRSCPCSEGAPRSGVGGVHSRGGASRPVSGRRASLH